MGNLASRKYSSTSAPAPFAYNKSAEIRGYSNSYQNKPENYWTKKVNSEGRRGTFNSGNSSRSSKVELLNRQKEREAELTEEKKLSPEEAEMRQHQAILKGRSNPVEREMLSRSLSQGIAKRIEFKDNIEKTEQVRKNAKIEQESWVQYVQREYIRQTQELSIN